MGISLSSAMLIAFGTTEIVISKENDKFAGAICHGVDHSHHPYMPILSTGFVYESEDSARDAMNDLIVQIKDSVKKKK